MMKNKYLRSNFKIIFQNSNSKIFMIIFWFKYEECKGKFIGWENYILFSNENSC